jgi:REP element-mobilizing transposase RayT
MPRKSRKKSKSGIYHIMIRGINRQNIFEDDEDHEKFLQVLGQYKEKCGYLIYAYCLMGNHVHLLIKEEKEQMEKIFKRIGARYVYCITGNTSGLVICFRIGIKVKRLKTINI